MARTQRDHPPPLRSVDLNPPPQTQAEFLCPECERVFGGGNERCPFDGSRLVNLGAGLAPGTVIDNRYTLKRLLGKGGMGSVYAARQHAMDRDVAIKIMHHRADGNHASVQRFFWEVRAARRLQSPHTITVFDFGQTDRGSLYLVMELLKGTTLGHLLSVERRMSQSLALRFCIQICRSLEEAHDKGIIHRDLKPENIFLVQRSGSHDFVKVLDFGVAKFLDPEDKAALTQTGTVFGTPRYMSPEQANSEVVDARSDLYSLGIMLYEMLTGRVPFGEDNALELLYKQVHAKPVPVCDAAGPHFVDPRLGLLVDTLLEKRRDARPASAAVVRDALEGLLASMPAEDSQPPPLPVLAASGAARGPAPAPRPLAETQQRSDSLEYLRRDMVTPSLGSQRSPDAQAELIVGRGAERELARAAVERGLRGPVGGAVVISGEPGLGKRRLARWLTTTLPREFGAIVGHGRRAAEAEQDMPEVRAALDALLGVTLLERAGVRRALEDHPALSDHLDEQVLDSLTDFLRPAAHDGPPTPQTAAPYALFGLLHRLFVRLSKLRPVVMQMGRLNDTTARTRSFLAHLVGELAACPTRIVIVGTIDVPAEARGRGLGAALEVIHWPGDPDASALTHVALGRLERPNLEELIRSLGPGLAGVGDYLLDVSGGIPRTAVSVARALESAPELLALARTWDPVTRRGVSVEALPASVVHDAERRLAVLEERLARYPHFREVLRLGALCGEAFDARIVEEALGRGTAPLAALELEPVLDVLLTTGAACAIGTSAHHYRFESGVLRELVVSRMRSPRMIQGLHGQIAAALMALPEPDARERARDIATHLSFAGDLHRALEFYLVHARDTLAHGALEGALQAYFAAGEVVERLRRLAPEACDRTPAELEVLMESAHLHMALGRFEQAASAYDALMTRARTRGDERTLAVAQRGLAAMHDAVSEFGAAAELLREARDRFASLGEELEAARCELLRASALKHRGALREAKLAAQQARQSFAQREDARGQAEAHDILGVIAMAEGESGEAVRHFRKASEVFRAQKASLDLGRSLQHLAAAATERRDLLMALDAANKALEIFDREGHRVGMGQCLGAIAKVLMTQRRPAEARPYFERALHIREELGDHRGVAEAVARLADIALALGQHDRALELATQARDTYTSIGEFLGAATVLRTMALVRGKLGRTDEALAHLREAVATYDSLSARDRELCAILESLAEVQTQVGLREEAKQTLARALDVARDLRLGPPTIHLEARIRALA